MSDLGWQDAETFYAPTVETDGGGVGGEGITGIRIENGGSSIVGSATAINFVGATVADAGSNEATVTIVPGGVRIEDEGSVVVASATAINFVGAQVAVTDAGSGEVTVTVTGDGGGGESITWPLEYTGAATTTDALRLNVTSDSASRIVLNSGGTIEWGPGNAVLDTDLFRLTSGELKTNGKLQATHLRLGTATTTAVLSLASGSTESEGIAFGSDTYLYRSGSALLRVGGSLQVDTNLRITTSTVVASFGLNLSSTTGVNYGIAWGSGVTLYKSASATLKTDGNLVVEGTLTVDGEEVAAGTEKQALENKPDIYVWNGSAYVPVSGTASSTTYRNSIIFIGPNDPATASGGRSQTNDIWLDT